jgi:hypothetical protein
VEKINYPGLSDLQKVKNTFFSTKKKKNPFRKIFLFSLLFILIAFLFLFKYEIVVLPKRNYPQRQGKSIFQPEILSSFNFLGKRLNRKKKPLWITFFSQEKKEIIFNFKKPLDLNKNYLILYLREVNLPLKIEIIARDIHFFSNSLHPLVVKLDEVKNYIFIPLKWEGVCLQNTNLSKIKQIKMIFYPLKTSKKNWIIIDDLRIIEKGLIAKWLNW